MDSLKKIKGLDKLPKKLSLEWIEQAMKIDRSQMTPDQRMHFNMMLAKNASIVYMIEEEKQQAIEDITEKVTKEVTEKVVKEFAVKTAKTMKKNGEPIDKIVEYSGLSKEEIEAL